MRNGDGGWSHEKTNPCAVCVCSLCFVVLGLWGSPFKDWCEPKRQGALFSEVRIELADRLNTVYRDVRTFELEKRDHDL